MFTGGMARIRSLSGSDNFIGSIAVITTVRKSVMKVSMSAELNFDCAIFHDVSLAGVACLLRGMVDQYQYVVACAKEEQRPQMNLSFELAT